MFCNEFFDIAEAYNVNYDELREVWLEDERISRSHTFVFKEKRGFDGKCLPKDVSSLIYQATEKGVDIELMNTVKEKNLSLQRKKQKDDLL